MKQNNRTIVEAHPHQTGLVEDMMETTLTITTARFGCVDVDANLIIHFPEGIIGFEKYQRYVVIQPDSSDGFRWLQSLDDPILAFPVLEPRLFHPDYSPTISDADATFLELTPQTPSLLLTVVTVPAHNPREMTANLLGPLVINANTRKGKQVIVQNEEFTTKHRVLDDLLKNLTGSSSPSAVTNSPVRSLMKNVA